MILCLMQFEPSEHGHGGSQRAYHLLKALAGLAPVHLVLLSGIRNCGVSDKALLAIQGVRTVIRIAIPEWVPSWHKWRWVPRRAGRWIDFLRMRSVYAPRFSAKVIDHIAEQLPISEPDIIFAGRLPAACLADALMARGLLTARIKVVDFDDVQSQLEQREARAEHRRFAFDRTLMSRLQVSAIRKIEREIASRWDAVSVCSNEDAAILSREFPAACVLRVPNVIDKPLVARRSQSPFCVMFVGNLGFGPNWRGLEMFVRKCWPRVQAVKGNDITMKVVGLNPPESLRTLLRSTGIELSENVPSVEPYYAVADAVIAPILFGSGTRVKILEAMAFGVPVVSTTMGAEGLEVVSGQHALIADDMDGFAAALLALADDPGLRVRLAAAGRALQQEHFSPSAMQRAVQAMISPRAQGPDGDILGDA